MKNTGMKSILAIVVALFAFAFAQDKTDWPTELNVSTVPTENAQDTTERYEPFVKYLGDTLGIKINFIPQADYAAVIVAMQSENLDVGFYGPNSYVDAVKQAGAEAFVREESIESGLGYHSMIITKADSGITTIEEAQGKSFAFVDPESTSGYKVPLIHFCKEMGVNPKEYFANVAFAGKHESVILGVANGSIEVGATNDLSISSAIKKGAITGMDEYNVLWESELIPASPVAYRGDLPDSLKAAIKDAFLSYDDEAFFSGLGLKGWVEASDSDYDAFRTVLESASDPECQM
jgi:phosphonate transport system substrate-binding protein